MRVDWLALTGFRSYQSLEWSPDPGVNVLTGRNGAGKTNVLEGIAYLSNLRSFRSVTDSDLISDASDSSVLRAGVISGDRMERLIEVQINRKGPRQAQVDKNRLRRGSDMLEAFRVVTFLPDDLDLVKRGPALRRDFLDDVAVQFFPVAYSDQSEYERALRQRNAFLKSGDRDPTTLGVWDSRLAQAGGRVLARRARVIETLTNLFADAYREISESVVTATIDYRATWDDEGALVPSSSAAEYSDRIARALAGVRRVDFDRRLTTLGPHRDEPSFRLDGVDARTHGSQGEQRSLALAAKLASHRAVTEMTGEPPALLLDDVFSELDRERSAALAKALPRQSQTIITSARPEDVPLPGSLWNVEDGIER